MNTLPKQNNTVMKTKLPPLLTVCFIASSSLVPLENARAQMYSDNFSSSTIEDVPNAYLGGFYGSNIDFGQWFGVSSGEAIEASISGGELILNSTSGLRGAFLVLAPSVFGSDTELTLTLDVASLDLGNAVNSATARVFTSTGYDMTLSSADALFINPQAASVTTLGGASVVMAAESTLAQGSGQTIDFTRPDGHAVLVFLGVTGQAWEFPEMRVSEMSVNAAIPEPSAFLLVGMGSLALLHRKRTSRVSGGCFS